MGADMWHRACDEPPQMSRSLLIIAALALTTGACTIHRHYHQAPAPQQYNLDDAPAAQAPGDYGDYDRYAGDDSAEQPIAPDYARPAAPPIDSLGRNYSYQYDSRRYEHRCDCDERRIQRRSAPAYRRYRRPGPVVPDNPADWLE